MQAASRSETGSLVACAASQCCPCLGGLSWAQSQGGELLLLSPPQAL